MERWALDDPTGPRTGRARGKPKGAKDMRITLPPRLEELRGMEVSMASGCL